MFNIDHSLGIIIAVIFITSYINREKEIIELFKNPYWLINTIIIAIFSFYVINIKEGKDEPIVMGAEPVLVTGKVNVGDYIVTSDKIGHGKSVKRGYLLKKDLFGKVIAQALESCDGDSNLIKCMIRKM